MPRQFDKQFKLDAVQYYSEHKDLGLKGCAKNLGVSYQTLSRWKKELKESGDIHHRGSGNYSSDLAKENARLKRELRNTQDALDILKKSHQHSGKLTETLYQGVSYKMEEKSKQGRRSSVSGMLTVLGVSRSGYYVWLNRQPSKSKKRREQVKKKISIIYHASKQNYGAPKITKELRKEGEVISERTVGSYMRQEGFRAQWVTPWTVTTKKSDFTSKLQNILEEDFNPERPNAVWCTDITYIWTDNGFVYLTSIMDLFSRKIIAWNVTETLEVSCVVDTVKKAKARRNTSLPLVLHSDRGSQYISKEYQRVTIGMELSYSAKASPWENACIESFHSLIKREWLNRFNLNNFNHAYHMIFEYIETFYNTVRIHSHCNYLSPNDFEKLHAQAEKSKYRHVS